ncbi:hypothetical protein HDU93_001378, partial [Gonapodya sp. JEL0774]
SFVVQPAMTILTGLKLLGKNAYQVFYLWLEIQAKRRPGKTLNRAEILLVQRTRRDVLVVFPFVVYSLLPFTLPTIPLILRFLPGAVPSTFVTQEAWLANLRQHSFARLRAATHLVRHVSAVADRVIQAGEGGTVHGRRVTGEEVYAAKVWQGLLSSHPPSSLSPTTPISSSTLYPLRPLFLTHFNLLSPPRASLDSILRFLDHPLLALPFVPSFVKRASIARWAEWVVKDDGMLEMQEGVGGTGSQGTVGYGMGDDEVVRTGMERGFTPILDVLSTYPPTLPPPTLTTLLPLPASSRTLLLSHLSSHVRLTRNYLAQHGSTYVPRVAGVAVDAGSAAQKRYLKPREMGAWASMVVVGAAVEGVARHGDGVVRK